MQVLVELLHSGQEPLLLSSTSAFNKNLHTSDFYLVSSGQVGPSKVIEYTLVTLLQNQPQFNCLHR